MCNLQRTNVITCGLNSIKQGKLNVTQDKPTRVAGKALLPGNEQTIMTYLKVVSVCASMGLLHNAGAISPVLHMFPHYSPCTVLEDQLLNVNSCRFWAPQPLRQP